MTTTTAAAPARISVVVCTRDRAASLERCLASLRATTAESPIEIVVVDNGSSDETPAVVERCRAKDPRLRSIREPVAGLSRARNRGVAEAIAPIVLFVDDDVTVHEGCVAAHLRVYDTFPNCAAAGGAVQLVFGAPRPSWWDPSLENFLAVLALPIDETAVVAHPGGVGANLSFRRSTLIAVGGFDQSLGRVGTSLISGEESEAIIAVQRAGGDFVLTGAARVDHHIGPERLRLRWFLARYFAHGRTRVRRGSRVVLWRALVHVVVADGTVRRAGRPWRQYVALAMFRRADWLGRAYETTRPPRASTPAHSASDSASTGISAGH